MNSLRLFGLFAFGLVALVGAGCEANEPRVSIVNTLNEPVQFRYINGVYAILQRAPRPMYGATLLPGATWANIKVPSEQQFDHRLLIGWAVLNLRYGGGSETYLLIRDFDDIIISINKSSVRVQSRDSDNNVETKDTLNPEYIGAMGPWPEHLATIPVGTSNRE